MVTFFTDGEQRAVVVKGQLILISDEMANCLMNQYRLMGWREEKFAGITNFFPKKG